MTTVIKDAFIEGRETNTDWDNSVAKRNQINLDLFAENEDNFNGRVFRSVIPLEQVCPDTGNVLRSFASRFDAAKWVVANVLKMKNDPNNVKAMSITGNMHMCMRMGWKSYGFLWRVVNQTKQAETVLEAAKKANSTPIFVADTRNIISKTAVYPSIREAARVTGVSDRQIRRQLTAKTTPTGGLAFRTLNAKTRKRSFADATAAAAAFGLREADINKAVLRGQKINNVELDVPLNVSKRVIKLFKGRKVVQTFSSEAKAAEFLSVPRSTISKALKHTGMVSGTYRVAKGLSK